MYRATKSYDLLICGGGVVGLSIAYQSAKRGWKVAVLDAGELGHGASWAGAGILPAGALNVPDDPIEQLKSLSHRLHAQWAEELAHLSGIDNEFRACGGLYLGRTPAERATLLANRHWWEEHGVTAERWEHERVAEIWPVLRELVERERGMECWWVAGDCRVRNPRHLRALAEAASRLGVDLYPKCRVEHLSQGSGSIEFMRTSSGEFRADHYCIATGAWASHLLEPMGVSTGIMPVRGQMVLYKLSQKQFDAVINDGHRYLVPREDGHVLAGSCEEEVGFHCETTEDMIAELKDWAEGVCESLRSAPVAKTWAGLRPGSFDSYPYLGRVPQWDNLYIAAGHFRHGLHWSTGTALVMQQLMFGEPTEIDLAPFRVLRGHNSH